MFHCASSTPLSRRILIKAMGAAASAGTLPRLAQAHNAAIRIDLALGFLAFGRWAPVYHALEQGWYAAQGLDVQVKPLGGNTLAFQMLATNRAQFCLGDLVSMMQLQGANPQPEMCAMAAIYHKVPLAIFYLEGKGIRTPKDLAGKTIADSPGGNARSLFPLFAAANGLETASVKWQSVSAAAKTAMLLQNQAVAITTYVLGLPGLQAKLSPGQTLAYFGYGDYGVQVYGDGLVTTRAFLDTHRDAARVFVQVTSRAYQETFANPQAAVASMAKHVPTLNPAVALQELDVVRTLALNPAQPRAPIGLIDPQRFRSSRDAVVTQLGQPIATPVERLFTNVAFT